jgi:hypothetical protein
VFSSVANGEFAISTEVPAMVQAEMKAKEGLGLIRGAKKLAGFIFDDEEEWKKVYPLKDDLGLFRLNGMICGRPETIVSRIAELEGRKSDADHPA